MICKRNLLLATGVVFLALLMVISGFTCTCAENSGANTMRDFVASYSEQPNANKVIFEGTVESQDIKTGPSADYRAVSIRVRRSYRGKASGTVTMLTGVGGVDCGFDFVTGQEYLVYAERDKSGVLFTSICSGTSLLDHAGPALRFLRGQPPTADDLLDPESYNKKFLPEWTGTACGRITRSDGTPVEGASVNMMQVPYPPFPPISVSDPGLSKPDGSFCVPSVSPGKYLLTAKKIDHARRISLQGYYPGVASHSEAVPVEIRGGDNLANLNISVREEPLFTVSFRIVAAGNSLPLDRLGVSIESTDRDALAYNLSQETREGDYYVMGYVPPGQYMVSTHVLVDIPSGRVPAQLAQWQMAEEKIDIESDSQFVLTLRRKNQ
jgi:hypothetical protein